MTSSNLKLFIKTAQNINLETLSNQQILLMNIFYHIKQHNKKKFRLIVLTDQQILYFQDITKNKIKRRCQITFQTRFQILREEPNFSNILGVPKGIKFEKEGFRPVQLFNNDPEIILLWKQILEKKMNQRGFNSIYKPIKKIGKGNFAEVYLAKHLQQKSYVCVKTFMKSKIFSNQNGKESLKNQINIMRKLSNQRIMRFYGVFQSNSSYYLIIEYLEGGTLAQKIAKKYQFQKEEIQKIMKNLLQALKYLSQMQILHRDIKPENILFRNNQTSQIVLCDLGLACVANQVKPLYCRCGTPGYVAPQIINIRDQKLENIKLDPICDTFSAGLIFHLLLFGKSIFSGNSNSSLLQQNRKCNFNLMAEQYNNLDSYDHHLLVRLLDKNPKTRITAKQALAHGYFKNNIQEKQNNQLSNNLKIGKPVNFNQSQHINENDKNLKDLLTKQKSKYFKNQN